MHDYIFLSVGRVGSSTDLIVQHVEYVNPNEKRQVLLDLINTVEVSKRTSLLPSFFTCPIGSYTLLRLNAHMNITVEPRASGVVQ